MCNSMLKMKKIISAAAMIAAIVATGLICADTVYAVTLHKKSVTRQTGKNSCLVQLNESKAKKVTNEEIVILEQGAVPSSAKALLDDIQKKVLARKTTFRVSYSGSADSIPSLEKIYDYIATKDNKSTSDDSDFLQGSILDIGYSAHYSGSNIVLDFKLKYTETAEQVKKINRKAKSVLKSLKLNKLSDVAKVKLIHDYVVKYVSYDNTLKDHSAYGGLCASRHKTVCQGYALIMYKLLTDAGVEAHYVGGDAGGPHAWNIVKVNNKWYNLDVTWDDPDDQLSYDYFLLGNKKFGKDHKLDKEYRKYNSKISSADLNWKKAIKNSKNKNDKKADKVPTGKAAANSKKARKRAEAAKMIADAIDETLNYDTTSELEINMYDLYKKIFGYILYDVSDEAFDAIMNDDSVMNLYMESTAELINSYILNPTIQYMSSDEFINGAVQALYEDFSADDFEGLSDKDIEDILEVYSNELFSNVLYSYSEQYTDSIVDTMVEALNSVV